MDHDEYDKVELPALDQLQQLGWQYVHGSKLSPESSDERGAYREVILFNRLTTAIQRINPWISEENLRKVVREITHPNYATLMEANQGLWQLLVQYQSVEQDLGKGRKGQTVKVIDFDNLDNNEFLCTNQFKIEGVNQNIIPDILLFVNGIPLGVIECKSPFAKTAPMQAGIDQLLRYANRRNPAANEGAERLFWYNQFMVSTHRDKARVGTISSRVEHYMEWKDAYPSSLVTDAEGEEASNSQQLLIAGMLNPKNCLDLVQNFTIFEPVQGRVIKKIARYQQFRAVHKTMQRLKSGTTKKDKGGVIWHTQGSGKSLTMVMLAIKMRRDPELRDYKLVFITDRTQLDSQLTSQFERAQGETVYHANSVADLKELLAKDSSDLVTCMVQKFQEGEELDFPLLNNSEKIVIMADEAHRTQYGTLGVAINTGLPNAPKIAFTGTPLITTKKTNNEFGTYIDTYTIEQAVADGATCQILYEGRAAATKVTGDSLDQLFNEYFGDRTPQEQQAIKKKYGNEQAVLEAPQRIRWICIDLLKHYRQHIQPNGFKAMIVTSSRRAAVLYKKALDELDAPQSEVIISGSHNDSELFTPYTDASKQKTAIENFLKPLNEHPLSILIVKDMLLTGFDAPICQVMYLDRKLRDHSLLQAIARVNRTNENKQRGFIVDYYGLSDYLWDALEMFSTEDVAGAMKNLKDEIPKLKATHTRVMKHFKGLDVTDVDACVQVLEDEEKRQQFEIDFKKFAQQLDIIMPDPAASPYLHDLKYLGKINQGARTRYRDEQLNLSGVGEKVRQLIEEHLHATGVDSKIPPVDLFAIDFKTVVDGHKSDRTKASEIEYAIRHHIKVNLEEDEEYYKSLSEKLKELLKLKDEHWDELVQLLFDFRSTMAEDRQRAADDLGLNDIEFSFHNILIAEIARTTGDDSINETIHDEVIVVTKQLVSMLDEATEIVDFFNKQNEIKRVQKKIKRTIIETSFDDAELRKAVMDRFMELAKVKFK
ncbi:MAG: type I restriction endonuclease subunit R [Deltaproteobacteria bacterium]|nr:type I restriction endonuclease subunit R [Deltaproteobacteria bacterium]